MNLYHTSIKMSIQFFTSIYYMAISSLSCVQYESMLNFNQNVISCFTSIYYKARLMSNK